MRLLRRHLAAGVADQRLYALGDLASGSLFFTFDLPSLVDRAYDIPELIKEFDYSVDLAGVDDLGRGPFGQRLITR
ncbi:MAG: hypothetical protein ACRDQ4_02590 [Pseudonocardiaceae bacterium]